MTAEGNLVFGERIALNNNGAKFCQSFTKLYDKYILHFEIQVIL